MKKLTEVLDLAESPGPLNEQFGKLIGESSLGEGPKVAVISQNKAIACGMLNHLLKEKVNVTSVLFRDEEIYTFPKDRQEFVTV